MIDNETYFDYAATSPISDECAKILRTSLEESILLSANPSSPHSAGKKAKARLESARESCAKALGVKSNQIFFTSGGTESDHIALLCAIMQESKGRIAVSSLEHPAVREFSKNLSRFCLGIDEIESDENGFITEESVQKKLFPETKLVSVMAVNNETGAVMPIQNIAEKIRAHYNGKRRAHFHSDCVQAVGKIEMDFLGWGIDSASISLHKLGGPRGFGILFVSESQKFRTFLSGGGQESGIRSGTENLFGAICAEKILEKRIFKAGAENPRLKKQTELTAHFIDSLTKIEGCSIVPTTRNAKSADFSPWILQAAFKGIPGNVLVRALDAKGFCISTGSACSSKKLNRPILQAMKISQETQSEAVRFSFGHETTENGMKKLLEAIKEIRASF